MNDKQLQIEKLSEEEKDLILLLQSILGNKEFLKLYKLTNGEDICGFIKFRNLTNKKLDILAEILEHKYDAETSNNIFEYKDLIELILSISYLKIIGKKEEEFIPINTRYNLYASIINNVNVLENLSNSIVIQIRNKWKNFKEYTKNLISKLPKEIKENKILKLMVQAHCEGAIDFKESDTDNDFWWLKLRIVLEELYNKNMAETCKIEALLSIAKSLNQSLPVSEIYNSWLKSKFIDQDINKELIERYKQMFPDFAEA